MKYSDNLQEFISLNALPFDTWNEIADFLDVSYVNGGAQDAIKRHLLPVHLQQPAQPPAPQQIDLFRMFAEQVNPYIKAASIDENQVIDLISKHAKPYTAKTEIFINDTKRAEVAGRQHEKFNDILVKIAAGLDLYLYGAAGTGKTRIAQNAAKALNKDFYAISVCNQTTKSEFLGYPSATGAYITTHFRKAYENGGVFLIDEIDNGNPNILAVLNSAMDGICGFPDAMVNRHPDFICIATANTFGTGATREYVGRNQLDASTLDRFTPVEIQYDEAMEREVFGDVAKKVQAIRKKLQGERAIVSMRSIASICKLMRAGKTEDEAIQEALIEKIPHNLRGRIA